MTDEPVETPASLPGILIVRNADGSLHVQTTEIGPYEAIGMMHIAARIVDEHLRTLGRSAGEAS